MNLTELVKMRGLDTSKKIKLVRHRIPIMTRNICINTECWSSIKAFKAKILFGNCDYILSFLGEEGKKATFIGAYEKISRSTFDKSIHIPPVGYPYMDILEQPLFHYHFKKIPTSMT